MKEFFIKLDLYYKHNKREKTVLYIIKQFALAIATGLLGYIIVLVIEGKPWSGWAVFVFVVLAAIYFYLEHLEAVHSKLFPLEIVSHLTALQDLKDLNKSSQRKEKVHEHISNAIFNLNVNTCPIAGTTQENTLCSQDVKRSLSEVLSGLIEYPNHFLDCECRTFSVGIFLKNVYDPNWKGEGDSIGKPFSALFRDEFSLAAHYPTQIEVFDTGDELRYFLQSKIKESIDLNRFSVQNSMVYEQNLRFLFVPIPNVCADCPPDGVLVLTALQSEAIPTDTERILTIKGQIVANWLSKYNSCVENDPRISSLTEQIRKKYSVSIENVAKKENTR
jgi:hypothetical protein